MSLGKVLIVRPGALGDAVLTLPALEALANSGAEEINILGTPPSWAFLAPRNGMPRIHDFGSQEWLGLFADGAQISPRAQSILAETEHAIVYLGGETNLIEKLIRSFGVKSVMVAPPPLASSKIEIHAAQHLLAPLRHLIPDKNFMCASSGGALHANDWLSVSPEESVAARALITKSAKRRAGIIAFHPGSGGIKKCWPTERFAILAASAQREWNMLPLLFFGPADEKVRAAFEQSMPKDVDWVPVVNRPLREVVALLTLARVFVGNDSGMSHLAARITSVLSIFGPTDPEVWKPLGTRVSVLRAPNGNLNELQTIDVISELRRSFE